MKNPKVSVLIPMYNRNHYMVDCINSALNQTFNDYEVIVNKGVIDLKSFNMLGHSFASGPCDTVLVFTSIFSFAFCICEGKLFRCD